jgi:hypothetical protein
MTIKIIRDQAQTTFTVALDDVTVARLMEVADECHAHPCSLIAAMVHDVLEDDARMHPRNSDDSIPLH